MKAPETDTVFSEYLQSSLARSLTSMTGKDFQVTADPAAGNSALRQPVLWQQTLSFSPEPALWILADEELWRSAGEMTLAAVGIDSATADDCRSTWQEILSQTVGAFCTALSSDLHQEITAESGEAIDSDVPQLRWTSFRVSLSAGGSWKLKVAWSKSLSSLYDRPEPESRTSPGKDSTFSKTFELLLDVALPVNVSFGKTSLQIREVLKLNTGSIVELNRFVAEPVEVIVNDCVIARGEVVVVDGNYGVRITQLSSREERLRFGMAETSSRIGAPLR